MYVDKLLMFSSDQAVTAAAASEDVVDLGAARDIGAGEDLYIVTVCKVAMTDSSSDSTLEVKLEMDSTDSFTPDSSRVLYTFSAVSAAGTVKIAKLGPGDANYRYARLYYTPANGDLTAGTFDAFITHDVSNFVAYADNITIS
jgi:hypothetical protein